MVKRNICIFIILISILTFAESNEKVRATTTLFSANEEKLEKQNNYSNDKSKFTKEDEKDVILEYGGFSLRDRNKFLGVGITLITFGMSTFLFGLISTIVTLNYYKIETTTIQKFDENGKPYNEVTTTRTNYRKLAPFLGSIFMPLGGIISIFSIIPFSICVSINAQHNRRKKENGEKLTFFDRMNLNIGFVTESNTFREYENKLDLSMSISL